MYRSPVKKMPPQRDMSAPIPPLDLHDLVPRTPEELGEVAPFVSCTVCAHHPCPVSSGCVEVGA